MFTCNDNNDRGCSGLNYEYDDIVATDNVKHLCILEGM